MRCIKSPFSISSNYYKLSYTKMAPSFNDRTLRLRRSNPTPVAVKTTGMVFLSQYGVSSTLPPPSPDLKVLLSTSVALMLLYWIANFVVPDILYKNLQSDDAKEEDNEK